MRTFGACAVRVPAIAIVLAAVTAPPASAEKYDLGLTAIFEIERLTIVWPTLPEGPAETARLSAESRADFLRRVHDVDVEVVADDAVSGAQLSGNLLVLGWTNRLLRDDRAPAPFTRTSEALVLDGTGSFPGAVDFGFVYPSPYNSTRLLFFWSRIDPEIDRFQVLPFEGSHWVVYRRFLPIAQGMWAPGSAWPPSHDPDARIDHRAALRQREGSLAKTTHGAYDVLAAPGEIDARTLDAIARARQGSLEDAAGKLAMAVPDDFRVRPYLYADEDAKRKATGIRAPVHSVPRDHELHMLARYAATRNPHEEIHLLAAERYGPCRSTALYEGLAIDLEDAWAGGALTFHAARLLDADAVPDLADLLTEGGMRALAEDRALPAAALLVRWIRERADEATFARLYLEPWPDLVDVAAAVGVAPAELDGAFRSWLRSMSRSATTEVAVMKLLEQARDRHEVADYPGLVEVLRRVLELRPGEPQTLFNLASAQMRTGDYDAAERNLRAILEQSRPDDDPLVVFGHYQLGRLYDIQGRRDDAVRQYRRVLELPDVRDSHRSAREALAVPFTPDRLE